MNCVWRFFYGNFQEKLIKKKNNHCCFSHLFFCRKMTSGQDFLLWLLVIVETMEQYCYAKSLVHPCCDVCRNIFIAAGGILW